MQAQVIPLILVSRLADCIIFSWLTDQNCTQLHSFIQDFDKTDDVRLLLEMFPSISLVEATHCLSLSNGSVEEAVQLVLHRQEIGESISNPEVLYLT